MTVHQSALGLADLVTQLVDTLSKQATARQCTRRLHTTMVRRIASTSLGGCIPVGSVSELFKAEAHSFNHLLVEVIALAGALPYSSKYRETACDKMQHQKALCCNIHFLCRRS